MFRRITTIGVIAAAAGGPYLATNTEMGRETMSSLHEVIDTNGEYLTSITGGSSEDYAGNAHRQVEMLRRKTDDKYRYDKDMMKKLGGDSAGTEAEASLVGVPINDLREVMRFDISPDWVTQRFTRVSTVLADLKLEGMRVPVVTGTRADDLAGTLTYYFDSNDKLQRVSIHAFTGDPNRLVGAMTRHYGMTREPSLEAGVYTKRWNGLPVHFLRLSHAPVIHSDAVHRKFTVFLELNEPNLAYGISHEARKIVHSDRMSGRW